jgi:hypothetical protein
MILQTLPVALGPNSARSQTRDPRKAAPTTDNLLPFDERFEVVESFFETLAIHALNHDRIGDLAPLARIRRLRARRVETRIGPPSGQTNGAATRRAAVPTRSHRARPRQ